MQHQERHLKGTGSWQSGSHQWGIPAEWERAQWVSGAWMGSPVLFSISINGLEID